MNKRTERYRHIRQADNLIRLARFDAVSGISETAA
jgi:hypothetical protein